MKHSRREILSGLVLAMGLVPLQRLCAQERVSTPGNFNYIYSDAARREEFKKFLVNVFHLFPENDLHGLIYEAAKQGLSDEVIYRQVQAHLGDIKPLLADVTYSLPTLAKQKRVLSDQTVSLIDTSRRYE